MSETIIFKHINDEFAIGSYLDFEVIIMKSNGYINVTRLCNDISVTIKKDKRFRDWSRLQASQELIKAVEEEINRSAQIPADPILSVINVENYLKGQYVHEYLIPHIASWASPKIAIQVSKIVNEYNINKIKSISDDEKKLIGDKYEEEIKKSKLRIETLEEVVVLSGRELNEYKTYLNTMKDYILIYKGKTENTYYIARVNKRSLRDTLRNNNDKELLNQIDMTRNAVELFYGLKTKLEKEGRLKILSTNEVQLSNDYTLEEFIEAIRNAHL
ncbi:MAG: KilA-N domain-containing protein [Advenella sp.]